MARLLDLADKLLTDIIANVSHEDIEAVNLLKKKNTVKGRRLGFKGAYRAEGYIQHDDLW